MLETFSTLFKMQHINIQVPTLRLDLTPYAFAKYAKDFFECADLYLVKKNKGFSTVPYYLYSHGIELALKALYLNKNPENVRFLASKKNVGHDLVKALEVAEKAQAQSLLSRSEKNVLKKLGDYYGNDGVIQKGFEYFTGTIKLSVLRGHKDLPKLKVLSKIANKLLCELESRKFNIGIN